MYNTIAETSNFIVLDRYNKYSSLNESPAGFQSESALEREFIQDLINQGIHHIYEATFQYEGILHTF